MQQFFGEDLGWGQREGWSSLFSRPLYNVCTGPGIFSFSASLYAKDLCGLLSLYYVVEKINIIFFLVRGTYFIGDFIVISTHLLAVVQN